MKPQQNAGDPKEVKKAARDERLEEKQLIEDYRSVLGTPQGRRLMTHILKKQDVWASTFTGNSNGMRLEGRREMSSELWKEIAKADIEAFILMIRESLQQEADHG